VEETRRLASAALHLIAPDGTLAADAIRIDDSQRGEAYGVPTNAMVDALRIMARSEGLLLDPVYSGKAFAGVLDGMRKGVWEDRDVLFVMTGGTPGLFAYRDAIASGG
jgi:D-cysteine desulfhydrase